MSLEALQRDPTAAWAISRTIRLEGGLEDDPSDPGGITDHGVSLRQALAEVGVHPDLLPVLDIDHDGHVTAADIRQLTTGAAAQFYYETFWAPEPYGRLLPAMVAWKVFDIAVNTGPKRAATILQQALNACTQNVGIDGDLGPQTIAAVRRLATAGASDRLLRSIRSCQAGFYRGLAAQEPKLQRFLKGWLNRAAA